MLAEMIRICHRVPVSSSRNIVAFEHRDVRRYFDECPLYATDRL